MHIGNAIVHSGNVMELIGNVLIHMRKVILQNANFKTHRVRVLTYA